MSVLLPECRALTADLRPAVQAGVPRQGIDLLRSRSIRALVLWCGFPYVFQSFFLAVFIGLAVLGWSHYPPAGVNAKLFAKCNLVNLVIWGLWWPAMVWTAVLFGRAWCMVCPLELVSNVSERIGRRMGLPQRSVRKWLASGAVILALYGVIQMLVAGAQIHRVPHYTALFLIALLAAAVMTGFLLKDRAFCRAFCPVGLLLGTYGRGGMLAVRTRRAERCSACSGRECLAARNRNNLDGRSCPSLLNPSKLNTNRDCLLCGQCIKACRPDNMTLVLRPPFSADDAREPLASWPVTLFVMLVSGFVLSELCSEWPAAEHAFKSVPEWAARIAGVHAAAGWITGMWALFVVPVIGWTALGAIIRLLGGSTSIVGAWQRLALPMAVVVAAGHMAKGLAKIVSWCGFLPYAVTHPNGLDTAQAVTRESLAAPPNLLAMPLVACVGIVLIAVASLLAVRESRLASPHLARTPVALPIVAVATGSAGIVCGWALGH